MSTPTLTSQQWQQYDRDGYLRLGKLLTDDEVAALCARIDDIMLGKADVDYSRLQMQLESDDGDYGKAAPRMSSGHKRATLEYRKIQMLELDPLFMAYMQRPLFRAICAHVYGADVPVACFRAMFMNKPAGKGRFLPWHQDRWRFLDRDPLVTVWTALDPATIANGCVQIIPGSHKRGVINPDNEGGFLKPDQYPEFCPKEKVAYLELKPGEVALLHNWLLHSSDVNQTDIARRAFSVCYLDARTHSERDDRFTRIFDPQEGSQAYAGQAAAR